MNKKPDQSPRKALGKGLSALLPARSPETVAPSDNTLTQNPESSQQTRNTPDYFEQFQNLSIDKIEPDHDQPRESFDQARLEER